MAADRGSARLEELRATARDGLVGLLGIDVVTDATPTVVAEMRVHTGLMAPNGFLHGGSIVALADTACGFGCWLSLPEHAPGFTTVELKTKLRGRGARGHPAVHRAAHPRRGARRRVGCRGHH